MTGWQAAPAAAAAGGFPASRHTASAPPCRPSRASPALQASPYKSTAERIAAFDFRAPGKSALAHGGAGGSAGAGAPTAAKPSVAHQAGGALTVPQSPRFATKRRVRPPRFKPREEVEAEEMAAMPRFKARPVK